MSVLVDTFGTGKVGDDKIAAALLGISSTCAPTASSRRLDLAPHLQRRPVSHGHAAGAGGGFTWERRRAAAARRDLRRQALIAARRTRIGTEERVRRSNLRRAVQPARGEGANASSAAGRDTPDTLVPRTEKRHGRAAHAPADAYATPMRGDVIDVRASRDAAIARWQQAGPASQVGAVALAVDAERA